MKRAAFLVLAGVGVESFCGNWADDVSDQIRIGLQTELIEVSPRPGLLYGETRSVLIGRIAEFRGQKIEVRYCTWPNHLIDQEEWSTAELINAIARKAEWDAPPMAIGTPGCGGQGAWVEVSSKASPRTWKAAELMRSALEKVPLAVNDEVQAIEKAGDSPPQDANAVVVLVCSHPLAVKGLR